MEVYHVEKRRKKFPIISCHHCSLMFPFRVHLIMPQNKTEINESSKRVDNFFLSMPYINRKQINIFLKLFSSVMIYFPSVRRNYYLEEFIDQKWHLCKCWVLNLDSWWIAMKFRKIAFARSPSWSPIHTERQFLANPISFSAGNMCSASE